MEDKIVLITGGTGSFGKAMVTRLLPTDIKKIIIFSRDEFKQDMMRKEFNDSRIEYVIGNVRNRESLDMAMVGVTHVFHASALKQVPSCEKNVWEAVQTNIIGTNNVVDMAIKNKIEAVVCLSTDKACYPINAMGMTKATMEKLALSKSHKGTRIMVTRYGNVVYSRGSVLPIFKEQCQTGKPLTVTNPKMTRFLMTLEDAVDLVLYAWQRGETGDTLVAKAKATTLHDIAQAMVWLYGDKNPIHVIGERAGEKSHEVLVSEEEMSIAIELEDYIIIPKGLKSSDYLDRQGFTSENCTKFNIHELSDILKHDDNNNR